MIQRSINATEKKKKEKEKKAVKDDFYDRINYYESRNIFNSNEPFNPNNRLYTDQASLTHSVWNTIRAPVNPGSIQEGIAPPTDTYNKEITQTLLANINKFNNTSSYSQVGCSLCGYGML
jgi:hypothetical protein